MSQSNGCTVSGNVKRLHFVGRAAQSVQHASPGAGRMRGLGGGRVEQRCPPGPIGGGRAHVGPAQRAGARRPARINSDIDWSLFSRQRVPGHMWATAVGKAEDWLNPRTTPERVHVVHLWRPCCGRKFAGIPTCRGRRRVWGSAPRAVTPHAHRWWSRPGRCPWSPCSRYYSQVMHCRAVDTLLTSMPMQCSCLFERHNV